MNKLVSPRRNSPFETNKENSPFLTASNKSTPSAYMFQSNTAITPTTPTTAIAPSTLVQYGQQNAGTPSSIETNNKLSYLKQASPFMPNGYSKMSAFNENNLVSGRAPSQIVNGYKYSQTANLSANLANQFAKSTSTPPAVNNSLTAATAAASAAIAAQQNQQMYKIPASYNNYEYLSLQPTNQFADTNREKSLENSRSFRQPKSEYSSLNHSQQAAAASIVSKRAALFEQRTLSPQQQQQQGSESSSRRSSFNRQALSPDRFVVAKEPGQEDSSGGSHKENKRPMSLDNIETNAKEPSKLSMSEKMKLFSAPHTNDDHDPLAVKSSVKSANKRNMNRFQPQVNPHFYFVVINKILLVLLLLSFLFNLFSGSLMWVRFVF